MRSQGSWAEDLGVDWQVSRIPQTEGNEYMMHSHLQSLIAKAHRYQAEPERFRIVSESPLTVSVNGANGDHRVMLEGDALSCDCDGFARRGEGICPHVLGVEHHYRAMVPAGAVTWPFAAPA